MAIGKEKDQCNKNSFGETTKWDRLEQGCMKINVDEAFDEHGGGRHWSGGSNGAVQLTAWKHTSGGSDAEELEALVSREGLLLAAEWRCQPTILKTDCSSIGVMLRNKSGLR
jgi:hypothetical protein